MINIYIAKKSTIGILIIGPKIPIPIILGRGGLIIGTIPYPYLYPYDLLIAPPNAAVEPSKAVPEATPAKVPKTPLPLKF